MIDTVKRLFLKGIEFLSLPFAITAFHGKFGLQRLNQAYNTKKNTHPEYYYFLECIIAAFRYAGRTFGRVYMEYALRQNASERHVRLTQAVGFGGGVLRSSEDSRRYIEYFTGRSIMTNLMEYCPSFDIKEGDSVLDVGCGGGVSVMYLKQHYQDLTICGIDFRDEAIEHCKRSLGDDKTTFLKGDLKDTDFLESLSDDAYDWIMLHSVLIHIVGDTIEETCALRRNLLSTLFRKCKRGLVITDARIPCKPYVQPGRINVYHEDFTKYLHEFTNNVSVITGIKSSGKTWGYLALKQ